MTDNVVSFKTIGHVNYHRDSQDSVIVTTYYDANDAELSEEQYKALPDVTHAGMRKGTTTVRKMSERDVAGSDLYVLLKDSWEGFSFA